MNPTRVENGSVELLVVRKRDELRRASNRVSKQMHPRPLQAG